MSPPPPSRPLPSLRLPRPAWHYDPCTGTLSSLPTSWCHGIWPAYPRKGPRPPRPGRGRLDLGSSALASTGGSWRQHYYDTSVYRGDSCTLPLCLEVSQRDLGLHQTLSTPSVCILRHSCLLYSYLHPMVIHLSLNPLVMGTSVPHRAAQADLSQ